MSATLFNLTPIESARAPKRRGRSARNYRDHREVLANIPPRRMGESLQVYFW
jgi:hypothetical protein